MAGYNLTNVFIDQEGVVWDMTCGKCPRCMAPSEITFRQPPAGYFHCPDCQTRYDEPVWDPPEDAFVTCISDDQAREDPQLRPFYDWYHDYSPFPGPVAARDTKDNSP